MTADDKKTKIFLNHFEKKRPAYYKEIQRTIAADESLFFELASPMINWASSYLGEGYEDILIDGYCTFVNDVNRSQIRYEKDRRYQAGSFQETFEKTYDSSDFMNYYHWGVFMSTCRC